MNKKNDFFQGIKALPLIEKLKALRNACQSEDPVLSKDEAYKQAQMLIARAKRAKNKTKLLPFLMKQTEKPKIRVSQDELAAMVKNHLQTAEGIERRKILKLIEFFLLTKRQNLEVVSDEDVALISSTLRVDEYPLYESQYDGIIHVAFRFKGRLITREAERFADEVIRQNKGSFRFIFTLFDEGYISHRVKGLLERHAETFLNKGYGDTIAHQLKIIDGGDKRYQYLVERYQSSNPENWIQED